MYKHRVKKVAPVHKYFSSNCLVKCHHPYIAICWATRLSSPQSARQRDHQLRNAQALAVLKRIFSQPLSHKHCSLPALCSSRLPSLLYMSVFIQHCVLKLVLGWSSSCKYFAEQTLQTVSLFSAAKGQLTNWCYSVPLRRHRSFRVCQKSWAVWCQNCILAASLPTCPLCNSVQLLISFPKISTWFFVLSHHAEGPVFPPFSLWHLPPRRPAEFRDICRNCQRQIPRQDAGVQVGFQDLGGGASPNRSGQEPWLCSCL